MDTQGLDPKTQELLALFSEAQNDSAKMAALMASPIEAMEKLGIEVDPQMSAAVTQGLRSAALISSPAGAESPAKRPAAKRTMARSAGSATPAPRFEDHIKVSAEFWGIVVTLDHTAVSELPKGDDGIDTIAAAVAGVCSASTALGPAAVMAILGLAYWGAILTAYFFVLPPLDQGKGVYLTVTWPQIAAGVASGGMLGLAMLPIPTTVV